MELGDGEPEWTPLSAGDEVTMVHGPQGGWHVLGSLKTYSIAQVVTVHFTAIALDQGGLTVADDEYRVAMIMDDETCSGNYHGMYGYLDVSELAEGDADTPPELLAGQQLRLAMAVEDSDGREVSAEIDVIAALDEMDQ